MYAVVGLPANVYRGMCSSKIFVISFSRTGLVKNKSTPLANASCCALADAIPVSATIMAGRNPFALSKALICRVDSRPVLLRVISSRSIEDLEYRAYHPLLACLDP